mmetsp:Transcript_87569/g.175185  ORF Transcript_87569/g.175185 Transcript_87569/m.175185 type:complete len:406 (-) Transcript_87569:302-1519(-)
MLFWAVLACLLQSKSTATAYVSFSTGISPPMFSRQLPIVGGFRSMRRRRERLRRNADRYETHPDDIRFTIMGGGSFSLAMAHVLATKGIPTTVLVRKETTANFMNEKHSHPSYLSDMVLMDTIVATSDPTSLETATHIIHAVPVQFTREYIKKIRKHIPESTPVLSVSKGIETRSGMLMCEMLEELLGSDRSYAFLSGPSFAREIIEGKATAVVIASNNMTLANDLSELMSSRSFRVFTSRDVIGLEVGGAVKNVIALAAGMSEGLGLGTNAMAALVTRGCVEMRRISISLGGRASTLSGLSGVGDTFGTCFGPLSRNRNLGIRIGRGEKLKDIIRSSTEVAEGVDTAFSLEKILLKINKSYRRDLKFPIIFGVCEILKGKITPEEGLNSIMDQPLRSEVYHFDE